jgi:hypothetical protein
MLPSRVDSTLVSATPVLPDTSQTPTLPRHFKKPAIPDAANFLPPTSDKTPTLPSESIPSASPSGIPPLDRSALDALLTPPPPSKPDVKSPKLVKRFSSAIRPFTPPERSARLAEVYDEHSLEVVQIENDLSGLFDGLYLEEEGMLHWDRKKREITVHKVPEEEDRFQNAPEVSPEMKALGFEAIDDDTRRSVLLSCRSSRDLP